MGKVFGVLLENVPTCNGVPYPVYELISYLTEKQSRIEAEGIFRISGKLNDINIIKAKYDNGESVDLSKYDIHTVAAVLKAFFRELPDSLVTHENTDMIIATVQMDDKFYPTKIKNIQNILTFLPDIYYETLKLLIHYLRLIADASSINKMNVSNISVIFGVNIFTGIDVVNLLSSNNSACFACTRFLIENYKEVFDIVHDNSFKTMQLPQTHEPEKKFLSIPRKSSIPQPKQSPSQLPNTSNTNSARVPKHPLPPLPKQRILFGQPVQQKPSSSTQPISISPSHSPNTTQTLGPLPSKPPLPVKPIHNDNTITPTPQLIHRPLPQTPSPNHSQHHQPISTKSETSVGRSLPPIPQKRSGIVTQHTSYPQIL
ncbi:Rho GTPase-activating protein, putative [Entamoeba dispar SAW760]|uniref:Rho GTPase-activating protein, putative n=1 Tax=Entamoeba dispar (strain ATCC PRA-260 / SAW760) TaxID=370354 RepID=B0EAG6_ENTDS|nr:Rho GTPase-activating protein, putative [Entamoeba dispar SAW760]EDR28479.1 Rho GTPase-activating protein, putative [Entamoeba dispar SAW760]|eukprot:EDR28479.1 Rho GTPase-activating protein, putative [Entamoeba dispar SAW760]